MSNATRFARLLQLIMSTVTAPAMIVAQTSGCEPSLTAVDARGLLRTARFTVSNMHPSTFQVRAAVGLRLIDTTKVVLTTTAKLCTDAVAGINAKQGTPGRVRRIYLVKLNTDGYMALDPVAVPGSESRPIYVLTRQLAVTNVLLGM